MVVASHSWGDNVFRNFLVWVTEDDPDWVEKHIHAYVNIAGPVLGVAKSMTSLLSGLYASFHQLLRKRLRIHVILHHILVSLHHFAWRCRSLRAAGQRHIMLYLMPCCVWVKTTMLGLWPRCVSALM